MVRLRAEEHRYIISASGLGEALVRRIPGARFNAGAQGYQLPRQPGVILALDELLGADGWECPADTAQEVSEARNRVVAPAQQAATVELAGSELSVECAFADKELVKLVPGYRWSAPQRRWFIPAAPMALDMLRRHFSDLLSVEQAAEDTLALRRVDEDQLVERARRTAAARPEPVPMLEPTEEPDLTPGAETPPPAPPGGPADALGERLDRLAAAVEELVSIMKERFEQPIPTGWAPHPQGEAAEELVIPVQESGEVGWRELLSTIDADPTAGLEQANRAAQTATPALEPAYRVVAGLAQLRLHRHEDALGSLRRGLELPGALDADLAREAAAAYEGAVLVLLERTCGAESAIESTESFRRALHDELVSDTGFRDEALTSTEAQRFLDYLVNDPVLRRVSPDLSDYCRVAHLLGVARAGQWMAATRITDVLREDNFGPESFSLTLILLANALYEGACLSDWDKAWPREDVQETFQDLSWLVALADERLKEPGLDPSIAEAAALACLACIAGGPLIWANTNQRKSLVQLIPLRNGARREYAEFLAGFPLAASGQKSTVSLFPGWTKILAQTRLSRSASYLMDVAANDQGGSGSLTWALAESVYLQALDLWGIEDPQSQLIDLLDLLEGGKKASSVLTELAARVEDATFPGSGNIPRELRKRLYQRALAAAISEGHDKDAVASFDRLVRELRDEGAGTTEEVRTLCELHGAGMKALRGPALAMLLNIQLENGEPFQETADTFARQFRPGDEPWDEFAGLALAYPEFRAYVDSKVQDTGLEDVEDEQTFAGKRVVVAGGHPSMRTHALAALQRWNLNVTWLGPDEVKGDRARDAAKGAADLVVVNTACIGHAGSGRVVDAADGAGIPVHFNHGRGAGSLILSVWVGLGSTTVGGDAASEARVTLPGPTKHQQRKKLVR